jgi:hypothetical protein
MREQSQIEEAVCVAALNVPDPGLRARFLDRACAGDAGLRAAVEAMLLAHAEAEPFFAAGQAAVTAPERDAEVAEAFKRQDVEMPPGDEQIGSWVGRYLLVQKLGEGGCGTVYLAEQEEPVRRQVALKVIKQGMDTRNVIARFEAERQALARMDHPNIARVLDAGATVRGRPYFVMEVVPGRRITGYCDEHNLAIDQRLKLFIQTCYAIQHAHQKGIIHRDIKPSNILVTVRDGVGTPKVIDFGIAKATEGRLTDHTLQTAAEQFVGTPAYMSPEQAENGGLDIDTRSDIYSLGVLLYELLTGRTPLDSQALMKSGWEEMRRTLREKEPPLPSALIMSLSGTERAQTARRRQADPAKLAAEIKGDLDWIVMKAMEKDRDRRYETASGLAMDVGRCLNSEPVLARPPNRRYRLQKLVRRNKMVFAAGGAMALALIIGLGMSTWLYLEERAGREREAHLRREAEDRGKITQAMMFVSQNKYEQANEILNQVKIFPANPTLDGIAVFRATGEWMALQGRWNEAAARYAALIKIDDVDPLDTIQTDYQMTGVVLAESGNREQYEDFIQMAATRFARTPIGGVLKTCLIFPVTPAQLEALKPLADKEEKLWFNRQRFLHSEWAALPFSLLRYRCGDYQQAIMGCEWGRSQKKDVPACDATFHAILAMAYYQSGQAGEAGAELAQSRQLIEAKFQNELDHGKSGTGFWYDWLFARLLLTEATGLIQGVSVPPEKSDRTQR